MIIRDDMEKIYKRRVRGKRDFRTGTGQVYYPSKFRRHLLAEPPGMWESWKAGLRTNWRWLAAALLMWALASIIAWIMFAGGKP